nr:MAG TPA: hemolysin [Caudoviricetes sp.]
MVTEIIIALITLAGSAVGTLGGIVINSRMSNYRIEQLEKKVDKHNSLIERTYAIEQHNAVVDEEIKVANHRIEDLEKNNERKD